MSTIINEQLGLSLTKLEKLSKEDVHTCLRVLFSMVFLVMVNDSKEISVGALGKQIFSFKF